MTIAFTGQWASSPNQVLSSTTNQLGSHAPAAGDVIVGAIACDPTKLTSIVDSAGGTVVQLAAIGPGGGTRGFSIVPYYIVNAAATARTLTANFSVATYSTHWAGSFSGLATGTPFDISAGGTGNSSSFATPNTSRSITNAVELLVGIACPDISSGTVTWAGGTFSGNAQTGGAGNITGAANAPPLVAQYFITSTAQAYEFTGSDSTTQQYVAAMLAFSQTNITAGPASVLGTLLGVGT